MMKRVMWNFPHHPFFIFASRYSAGEGTRLCRAPSFRFKKIFHVRIIFLHYPHTHFMTPTHYSRPVRFHSELLGFSFRKIFCCHFFQTNFLGVRKNFFEIFTSPPAEKFFMTMNLFTGVAWLKNFLLPSFLLPKFF